MASSGNDTFPMDETQGTREMGVRKERQAAGGHTLKHLIRFKGQVNGALFFSSGRSAPVFKAGNNTRTIYFKGDSKSIEDRQGRKMLGKVI